MRLEWLECRNALGLAAVHCNDWRVWLQCVIAFFVGAMSDARQTPSKASETNPADQGRALEGDSAASGSSLKPAAQMNY